MGDPRKQRKKYATPRHPWEAERIKEEKVLLKEYGLKNKKEIWKMESVLKKLKTQTKDLIGRKGTSQAEAEEKKFLEKLAKLNLIAPGAKIEDVLDIKITDILERRLQTQMLRKGLAKTPRQARQFIVHGHVLVNGKKLDVPSYLISKDEEFQITFDPQSNLADAEHPERVSKKKQVEVKTQLKIEKEEKKEETPKEEEKKEEVPEEEPKEEKKEEKVE